MVSENTRLKGVDHRIYPVFIRGCPEIGTPLPELVPGHIAAVVEPADPFPDIAHDVYNKAHPQEEVRHNPSVVILRLTAASTLLSAFSP